MVKVGQRVATSNAVLPMLIQGLIFTWDAVSDLMF